MILLDAFSFAIATFALYQVSELGKRIKALEARKPEPSGKTGQLPVALPEKHEQPKAGTVAAKAIQPVVFLSQVSHKAVQLDNGGMEWEGKI